MLCVNVTLACIGHHVIKWSYTNFGIALVYFLNKQQYIDDELATVYECVRAMSASRV